jgi:hypothetical protein
MEDKFITAVLGWKFVHEKCIRKFLWQNEALQNRSQEKSEMRQVLPQLEMVE